MNRIAFIALIALFGAAIATDQSYSDAQAEQDHSARPWSSSPIRGAAQERETIRAGLPTLEKLSSGGRRG